MLIVNGCIVVFEGVNMLIDFVGVYVFKVVRIFYVFGKVVNVGGVVVFGLEMSQNFGWWFWKEEEFQQMFKDIMLGIYVCCCEYGECEGGYCDYVKGVNIVGFKKVVDVMLVFGVV